MPTIHATEGVLVIRIVYDGPALSGKTSSLSALAQGVNSHLESIEERDGRTVYFDWMEYVGGLFEGRQIRCQIISVPGQRELAARRKLLLANADAVVCVLDTRRVELDYGLAWLADLVPACRAELPPVGVVLQANKRDAADAVPRDELRRRVDPIAPLAIVESVATAADGIREAFVLAVRLALDRVRALSSEGKLSHAAPAEDSAAALFANLQQAETQVDFAIARTPSERPSTVHELPAHHDPGLVSTPDELPFTPDPLMPGGMIWPPVDGRALLHEVASLGLSPVRTARGDWWGSAPGWRFHSSPSALYAHPDEGREALIAWARLHSGLASLLSNGRAVILADAGSGRMRLWQLVSIAPTLREQLDSSLEEREPVDVVSGVLEVSTLLARAREDLARSNLPCTLWSVGYERERTCFVGLMPMPYSMCEELALDVLLERELTPQLRRMRRTRVDFARIVRELIARAEQAPAGSVTRRVGELAMGLD
jgi:signal recognition particle receptor subunit beta